MKLLDSDTTWIFLSGSDEDRFLSDMLFGVKCLLHRKVPEVNILLFIDQPSGSNFVSAYGFPSGVEIFLTKELKQQLSARNIKKIVIVVTGHGGLRGISASPDIQPYPLLATIKSLSNIEVALVVLGQCYAGTFNFLEARSQDSTGQILPPEVCFLGATDLTYSVSITVDISSQPIAAQINSPLQWNANLFLLFFMLQVADPIDYDGDNRFSVLDAYKASGIGTNAELLQVKRNALLSFQQSVVDSTVSRIIQQTSVTQQLLQKAQQDLITASNAILTNQSPWILHANLARKLEL
ncbi:hypothetical protein ACQ4N7_08830 [Nodosilinea sp. AN01ver1]|uniref:hypothetical protein n=1 Tax=Nodosilinea sp. AN01ver1 TaxID=3423362 RepID=UPI003D321519